MFGVTYEVFYGNPSLGRYPMKIENGKVHIQLTDDSMKEALQYYATMYQEKLLDPYHPDLSATLKQLGEVYRDRREYEKAEASLQRALENRERELGPTHPQVSAALNDHDIGRGELLGQ